MTIQFSPIVITVALFFQNAVSNKIFAQREHSYSKEIEYKIKQVESNLVPWVVNQDNIKFTIEDRMKKYNIQGLSIAVIKNYKIEWVKAYGWADVLEKRPVTTETLFQAGSVSKSLNGVGVLKLVQDKKINLYDDINNYLTTWKFPYDSLSQNKKITIANLLSHTAGLSVHGFGGYKIGEPLPSIYDILDGKKPANSKAVRSIFEPGKKAEYSGGGTTISQLIVTDITHKNYEDYMWVQVLKPIGMTESFFTQPPPVEKKQILTTGYSVYGKELNEGKYNIYPEKAAAGLWTNPTDLAKYIIETQLSLKGKSNKVLSQQMTELRLTPYIDNEKALGVYIKNKGKEKYFGHSGGTNGFITEYSGSFENGNGIVIMTNSLNYGITAEIMNSVATIYQWNDFYIPNLKKTINLPNNILESFVGEYLLNGETYSIVKKENELWLNNAIKSKIYFTSETEFYSMEKDAYYKITKDSNGAVTGFIDTDNTVAKRIK